MQNRFLRFVLLSSLTLFLFPLNQTANKKEAAMIQVTTNLKHAIAKRLMSLPHAFFLFRLSALLVLLVFPFSSRALTVEEATVADVQAAFLSGQMSARQLVTSSLERIAAYDQQGPYINSIINLVALLSSRDAGVMQPVPGDERLQGQSEIQTR